MIDWPETLNVDNWILRDHLRMTADRVALRTDDRNVTFGELDSLASGFAAALLDAGVTPQDRVLVVLPDGPEYAAAVFGTFRMGAVVVMVNPDLSREALVGILNRAGASAAFVDDLYREAFQAALDETGIDTTVIDPAPIEPGDVPTVETSPNDPAIWLFSGGTTGVPKAVAQTHRSLVNTTLLYGQGSLALVPDDITISVPKLYFGYATGSNLLFPLSVGASSVLFTEHPTPEALFERIERHLTANEVDLNKTPMKLGPWLTVDQQTEAIIRCDGQDAGSVVEKADTLSRGSYRKPFAIDENI